MNDNTKSVRRIDLMDEIEDTKGMVAFMFEAVFYEQLAVSRGEDGFTSDGRSGFWKLGEHIIKRMDRLKDTAKHIPAGGVR